MKQWMDERMDGWMSECGGVSLTGSSGDVSVLRDVHGVETDLKASAGGRANMVWWW